MLKDFLESNRESVECFESCYIICVHGGVHLGLCGGPTCEDILGVEVMAIPDGSRMYFFYVHLLHSVQALGLGLVGVPSFAATFGVWIYSPVAIEHGR